MGKLNEQLAKVYNEKWEGFVKALHDKNTDLAYPFLLAMNKYEKDIPDETWYTQADIKMMIFGQESNTWRGIPDDLSFPIKDYFDLSLNPETIMGIYENQYSRYNLCPPDSYRFCGVPIGIGFLDKGINHITDIIDRKLKERHLERMPVCIWNDISKLGLARNRGGVSQEIHEIEQKYFRVIPEEVNILNPDVIIFLTGPNYDKYICENFNIQSKDFVSLDEHYDVRDIAKVNLSDGRLAYRTYHPCAIGKNVCEHHKAIVDDIMHNLDKILKK